MCLKPRSRRNQIGPEEAARPLSLAKHCNSKARHQGNRSCYRDRSRHVATPLRQHPSTRPSWGQEHGGSVGLGAAWPVPRGCPGTRGCGDGGEEWKWPSSLLGLLVAAGAALCPMPGLKMLTGPGRWAGMRQIYFHSDRRDKESGGTTSCGEGCSQPHEERGQGPHSLISTSPHFAPLHAPVLSPIPAVFSSQWLSDAGFLSAHSADPHSPELPPVGLLLLLAHRGWREYSFWKRGEEGMGKDCAGFAL